MYLSYYLDIASGASIVLLAALVFVVVLTYRQIAGAIELHSSTPLFFDSLIDASDT